MMENSISNRKLTFTVRETTEKSVPFYLEPVPPVRNNGMPCRLLKQCSSSPVPEYTIFLEQVDFRMTGSRTEHTVCAVTEVRKAYLALYRNERI